MSMNELPRMDGIGLPPDETGGRGQAYVREFEERFARLEPFQVWERKTSKRLEAGGVEIFPEKFAPVVLYPHDDTYDIFLGKRVESGYEPQEHFQIQFEHGIGFSLNNFGGYLMTSGESRFLNMPLIEYLYSDLDNLKASLDRYKITAVVLPKFSYASLSLTADRGGFFIGVDDYEKVVDNLIRDDWTSYVAQIYGLTNTEFLRLRLQGELPKDKTKPVRKARVYEDEFNLTDEEYMRVLGIEELPKS